MRLFRFLLMVSLFSPLGGCGPSTQPQTAGDTATADEIRFIPIGDSYTIGQGVRTEDAWPSLLTESLRDEGIPLRLIENPARTGWTTQDAIDGELPVFEASQPAFSTLLIGVNDWVQGVDAGTFRTRLAFLMDQMLAVLPHGRLIILTIPDYSVTPAGSRFGDPATNAAGVRAFNAIIEDEAARRSLPLVDLYPISLGMGEDPSLVADDGLHPSGLEYRAWEELIRPMALELLRN